MTTTNEHQIGNFNHIFPTSLYNNYEFENITINRVILFLSDKRNNINDKNFFKNTLLHEACTFSFFKLVKFLVKNGSDVNSQNNSGFTPLMISGWIENDNSNRIIIFLITKCYSDPYIKDHNGYSFYKFSSRNKKKDWIKKLIEENTICIKPCKIQQSSS
jgi:ankyrin repeat protein